MGTGGELSSPRADCFNDFGQKVLYRFFGQGGGNGQLHGLLNLIIRIGAFPVGLK